MGFWIASGKCKDWFMCFVQTICNVFHQASEHSFQIFLQLVFCPSLRNLLKSLIQGCAPLFSGHRTCPPLCASRGNKGDLTWWATSIGHIFKFCEEEHSYAGLKPYSLHSFHWLNRCIMYPALYIQKGARVSDINWAQTCFEQGLPVAQGHISFKNIAYISLFHNIH